MEDDRKEWKAKLTRLKGYWFVETELGTIDLGDEITAEMELYDQVVNNKEDEATAQNV